MNKSREGHVHITNVSLSASGIFRCEASGDAPEFKIGRKEKELKVFGEYTLKIEI